jgi:tRNA modification GTPase
MFATDDTIVAIATPPGPGGIGIVRVSGAQALRVATAILSGPPDLEPRRATLADALDPADREPIDRVLATYFPHPRSYTGEDVVEVSGHGSPTVLRRIVEAATAAGARLAEPGEFTFRAFLRGRIDLVQAEAIHDLVTSVTPRQARVAFDQLEGTATAAIGAIEEALFDLVARLEASLDFPEEGFHFVDAGAAGSEVAGLADEAGRLVAASRHGRLIREGCQVAVAGKPNVGKSSLFNTLCGVSRTIVADTAGTTRDLVTETIHLEGIPVTLVDTAGIRATSDTVEAEGVRRARGAVEVASVVVVVLDRSRALDEEDRALLRETGGRPRLVIANKRDLPGAWLPAEELHAGDLVVETCLIDGSSRGDVSDALLGVLEGEAPRRDAPALSNVRHIGLLATAETSLRRAAAAAAAGATEELLLADLEEARRALEEITGKRTPDAVIERIFEQFCIGK